MAWLWSLFPFKINKKLDQSIWSLAEDKTQSVRDIPDLTLRVVKISLCSGQTKRLTTKRLLLPRISKTGPK